MELHSNSNLHSCKTLFSLKKKCLKKVLWKGRFGLSLRLCESAPDWSIYNYYYIEHFVLNVLEYTKF